MFEKAIETFEKAVNSERILVEALAVGNEKEVLLERHYIPQPSHPRPIYSHTKSFTSTAAGIAISEGKLSLDDRPAEFFPERVPKDRPELYDITLRHLLMMASGFHNFYLGGDVLRSGEAYPDYIAYLFSKPLVKKPGEEFSYNNGDTYLAGKMVEKAVGMNLRNYLYEKLLSKAGIGYPEWNTDPEGSPFGATGMYLSVTGMLRLGQVFLAEGKWESEQLVDRAWVKEATSKLIKTTDPENVNDWNCGYGYQWWRSPFPDAYRADGAYGQITTVLPRKGLVVSVQCPESGDFEKMRTELVRLLDEIE